MILDSTIDQGASLEEVDSWGQTAFIAAIKWNIFDVAADLIDRGANLNVADSDGITPLMETAMMEQAIPLMRKLLKNGADIKAECNCTWTALHWAAERGCTENAIFVSPKKRWSGKVRLL